MEDPKSNLSRNRLVTELARSAHGKLEEYWVGLPSADRDPEFFSRLIAWNHAKGEVRDSKAALPVIGLRSKAILADSELAENCAAHLALLSPRDLDRALDFAKASGVAPSAWKHWLRPTVEGYLRTREAVAEWWDRTVITHRRAVKSLYARWHVKPGPRAQAVLFERRYPRGSIFSTVARLPKMTTTEAAQAVVKRKLPFLIVVGAMGEKAKETRFVSALIDSMSPAEVVNNTAMLEKLGVKTVPELRAAFEAALKRAAESKKGRLGSMKAAKAAESVKDEKLKNKLRGIQDKKTKAMTVKGRWLVLGDKSGSMSRSIEVAREVAASLASVAEEVHLVFFDVMPTYYPVTGKTIEEIRQVTKRISSYGGTSIGCGLASMLMRKIEVDGIAIVSDGGENNDPRFWDVYRQYSGMIGREVPVYFYKVSGDPDALSGTRGMPTFDLRGVPVDHYSIPNLVQSMRVNPYSLVDEIMETPLLKLKDALKRKDAPAA